MPEKDIWSLFKVHFNVIINNNDYYSKWFQFLKDYSNNVLLYGAFGFPTDLFIDEVIRAKYNLQTLHKTECTWNKDIVYYHNPCFLEINLMHPSVNKNLAMLSKFLTTIIKNKNISNEKHCIIIKNIDMLDAQYYSSYRIILERFSNNACFICTAHSIDKIDVPVKSRFTLVRMPLFTHQEIINIFTKMNVVLNSHLLADKQMRNIIKAIYIAEIERTNSLNISNNNDIVQVTAELCNMNFPPIVEFVKTKPHTIHDIKTFAFKCFQYNIGIQDLVCDMLKIKGLLKSKVAKIRLVKTATDIECKLKQAKKGKEPIYIETFLCQVFL